MIHDGSKVPADNSILTGPDSAENQRTKSYGSVRDRYKPPRTASVLRRRVDCVGVGQRVSPLTAFGTGVDAIAGNVAV